MPVRFFFPVTLTSDRLLCVCRNPYDDVRVEPGLLRVTANIVYGYAT